MKRLLDFIQPAAVLLAAYLFCGCSGPVFQRSQTVDAYTVRVPARTNIVSLGTNAVAVIVPETLATNWVTNVVFTVNPTIERALTTAQEINAAANPTPSAPVVNLVLGGIAGVLGLVARAKSKRAAILPAVIQGVESLGSTEAKLAIQRVARAAGVERDLAREVKRHTE